MNELSAASRRRGGLRPVRLGATSVDVRTGADGSVYVTAREKLSPYPDRLTERLEHWAKVTPDRDFMAQRQADGEWQAITYAETLAQVRALSQALIDRRLSAERPLVILSGNDLDHACLALAAMHAGIPYAPISPAYSLVATDFDRLRAIFKLLNPDLVFVSNAEEFRPALDAVSTGKIEIAARGPTGGDTTSMVSLLQTKPSDAVERAAAKVGPDTVAKFLFTSGSTGQPKAVINTQRMLCSNQQMLRQCFAFMQDEPPVLLDWSPWHHTAGGNHNFGLALYNGGTFFIDNGMPTPAGIAQTARNLSEIAPTWYFNVPRGYEALIPHLSSDARLRENFFSRVKMLYVAGAGLSQRIWEEYRRLAEESYGERILFGGGLGATESGPFALVCMWEQEHANNCGLPAPGVELKLAPVEDKLEGRLRGPNITTGYWKEPDLTAKAFDDEGFYRLGDALRYADPGDPTKGLLFDGRIAENFKLGTGTWVNVGALRATFVNHCMPYARDAVITGLNQDYVGALIFPNLEACRDLAETDHGEHIDDMLKDSGVRGKFLALLNSFAKQATGSSNRVEKVLLMEHPPSLAAGEQTDKGSLNQRAVLQRRAQLVAILYEDPGNPNVIGVERSRS